MDSKGLLSSARTDALDAHKVPFAHDISLLTDSIAAGGRAEGALAYVFLSFECVCMYVCIYVYAITSISICVLSVYLCNYNYVCEYVLYLLILLVAIPIHRYSLFLRCSFRRLSSPVPAGVDQAAATHCPHRSLRSRYGCEDLTCLSSP